jgi:hypothetical protein
VLCTCAVCSRHRNALAAVAEINASEELKELIGDLEIQLLNAESEVERYQAILSGKWPRSREILEAALKNIPV